jgi:amino acid adenylation domain-containing protein
VESLRERLEHRVRQAAGAVGPEPAAPPVTPGDEAPATIAQQGLWVVNELSSNAAFTVPILHAISGPLDVDALEGALKALVERHVALRTVFRDDTGVLMQVVAAPPEKVLRHRDVESAKLELRESQARRVVAAEIATPFNLTKDLPFRATLIRLAPEHHKLLLTVHHIACDQWSMGIFATELSQLYAAVIAGEAAQLPSLPISFLEFGRRQLRRDRSDGVAYFVKHTEGATPLRFATDRPRRARTSYSGDERAVWLGTERTSRVQECARRLGVSPFTVTLTAFLTLARAHAGSDDFVLGTSSAGREEDDVAGLVGFFVNTLALRATVHPKLTFADLAHQMRGTLIEAQQRSSTPYDAVVRAVGASGDGTGRALTAVMFQQDNTPGSAFTFTGCSTELDDDVNSRTAKYELLFSVRNQAEDTRVHVQFDTDLFEGTRIEAFLAALDRCLEVACDDPQLPVSRLPLVGVAEQKLLDSFNATDVGLPGPDTLHELVLVRARATPDAPALLAADGTSVTYGELVADATAASAALVDRGVGAGDTVLLQLPPGRGHMVCALAVLMSGAAYVPVDPGYPDNRVRRIRELAGAEMAVTDETTVTDLVNHGRELPAPEPPVDPDGTAYVIFTSGSTGQPKGVQVRHGGIANNLKDLAQRLDLGPRDRCVAVSSPSFDMSVFEEFGILACGGASVTLDPELRSEPEHWAERAADERATVWNSAPALLGLFLDTLESGVSLETPPLRLAVLGGDWVPLSMPGRWWSFFPGTHFDVLGGATEASIHSTYTRVESVEPRWKSIPYGRPMANQKAIVVDDVGRTCPIGVPGRLLLGGAGLAAGYFGDPDLTARAFVERADGERWYQTGDVALWTGHGTLELLGRDDFMIKLNGLRIEAGDVEAAMLRSGPFSAAVVMASLGPEPHLVGFLESDTAPDVGRVRSRLGAELPQYMVPAEFHGLTRMPLNSNGKLDRQALRSMIGGDTALTSRAADVPLTSDLERKIAAVWSEVLAVEVSSAAADFFELGGDSFKAVKAARMVAPDLPTFALFRHPTVAELAAYIELDDGGDRRLLVPLSERGSATRWRLVCVPYGGGNAVAYQPLADCLGAEVEVLAVNLPGHDLADSTPLQPIAEVADRVTAELLAHEPMRTAIYAQCAGCATADRLVRACVRAGLDIDMVFMGAALPDPDPVASMELVRGADDDLLLGHMRGLGGFNGALDDSDIVRIVRIVRHDLDQMVRMYLQDIDQQPERLAVPVHCVVGANDPATDGYEARYREWERVGTPVSLTVMPDGDHYFCATDPAGLADHIRAKLGLAEARVAL